MDVASGKARTRWSSRAFTKAAMATGLASATILVVVGARKDGDGGGGAGAGDWILGLFLILAPFLCAALVHSVTTTSVFRPVGGAATAICLLAATFQGAFIVATVGPQGLAAALPAAATPILLTASLIRGPFEQHLLEPSSDVEMPHGPPLDVATPLRRAVKHATPAALAWMVASVAVGFAAVPALRLAGWPEAVAELRGEVIHSERRDDRIVVFFAARSGGRVIGWARSLEESEWEIGQPSGGVLDDEGVVRSGLQFGLAGQPLFLGALVLLFFVGLSVRRVWGLALAWWDFQHGPDRPRLGYVALIFDPAPKMVRPLLAVWWQDPTNKARLPKPDAVYRADDETDEHLICSPFDVEVLAAWLDTGPLPTSKPRWVGTENGVAVPHRRAVLGRLYVRMITRRGKVHGPAPLHHRPPEPSSPTVPARPPRSHRFAGMLAWRVAAAAAIVALGSYLNHFQWDPASAAPAPELVPVAAVERAADHLRATTVALALPDEIVRIAEDHGLLCARRISWTDGSQVQLEVWTFPLPQDARAVADADAAMWALAGRFRGENVVAPAAEGDASITLRILVAGPNVLRLMVKDNAERSDLVEDVVAELSQSHT